MMKCRSRTRTVQLFTAQLTILSIIIFLITHYKLQSMHIGIEQKYPQLRTRINSISSINVDTMIRKLDTAIAASAYTSTLIIPEPHDYLAKDYSIGKPGSPQSIATVNTLLNIRKLILFAVNEVNQKLKDWENECFRYWANPLYIQQIEQTMVVPGGLPAPAEMATYTYTLKFIIEPGHLPFEASIKQDLNYLNKPFTVGIQTELKLISAKILDPQYTTSNCINSQSRILSQICLCRNITNPRHLIRKTNEFRKIQNVTDREWPSWPPNALMFITNYFSFGTKDLYLISPNNPYIRFCNSSLKMLIMIHSAPAHFKNRDIIRETYGNKIALDLHNVGLIFFLGTTFDGEIVENVAMEIAKFDDIVLVDFVDDYQNLTLKHLSLYNWIHTFCMTKGRYPPWILKADDDFLININVALKVAVSNIHVPLMGYVRYAEPATRKVEPRFGLWYVPRYIHFPKWFPPFFPGATYLVQTKWIPRFLQASLTTPLLYLDDVYVSGLLALQIGICPKEFPVNISLYNAWSSCRLKQAITSFANGEGEMKERWESLVSPNGSECWDYVLPKVTNSMLIGGCTF